MRVSAKKSLSKLCRDCVEIKDFGEMLCVCTYTFYCLSELFLCVFKLACWFLFYIYERLNLVDLKNGLMV